MNRSILKAFIEDQRVAKRLVADRLGIPEDIPARQWFERYPEIVREYEAHPFADVFYPHGYGLELKLGEFFIDYDYSITGRPDGFDAWRIFVYLTAGSFNNNGPDRHLCDRVFDWIEDLATSGNVIELDQLLYLVD